MEAAREPDSARVGDGDKRGVTGRVVYNSKGVAGKNGIVGVDGRLKQHFVKLPTVEEVR